MKTHVQKTNRPQKSYQHLLRERMPIRAPLPHSHKRQKVATRPPRDTTHGAATISAGYPPFRKLPSDFRRNSRSMRWEICTNKRPIALPTGSHGCQIRNEIVLHLGKCGQRSPLRGISTRRASWFRESLSADWSCSLGRHAAGVQGYWRPELIRVDLLGPLLR